MSVALFEKNTIILNIVTLMIQPSKSAVWLENDALHLKCQKVIFDTDVLLKLLDHHWVQYVCMYNPCTQNLCVNKVNKAANVKCVWFHTYQVAKCMYVAAFFLFFIESRDDNDNFCVTL